MRNRMILVGLAAVAATVLAACSGASSNHSTDAPAGASNSMSGMHMQSGSGHQGMGAMHMSAGDGLTATVNGYTLKVTNDPARGTGAPVTFTITKDGKTVTQFDREQTKLMHFYLIRSDLTGFQHLHPTMAADGTWSVTPTALASGPHRMYVQFLPHADAGAGALILGQQFYVAGPGAAKSATVPAPSDTAAADGYTITVAGAPKAGSEVPLKLTVNRSGTPVTDLHPYLDTYAHVTAIHQGDLAFAHLHPSGTVNGDGGPTLTVNAELPKAGTYRMFIQFQTSGRVHTAPVTIKAS